LTGSKIAKPALKGGSTLTIDDRDFHRLRSYMQENFGLNLEKKRILIEGRLSNTVLQAGFDNFTDFLDDVFSDKSGEKIGSLISRLTTNYTYFMREEAHYRFMLQVALPEWVKKIKDNDLRIWSAGCSSGEEPYTVAMVMDEYFGHLKTSWDTTILATDISPKVLAAAREGVYPQDHLERLPAGWRDRYFMKEGPGLWKIKPFLAKEVIFSQFNLMGSFRSFRRKFHIIFCRNVMIYFNEKTKAELIAKYYDVLEPGGYLFIGLSETLSGTNSNFVQISPSIYKKP
jgi:chemotaxis protein methyltransferase CheR